MGPLRYFGKEIDGFPRSPRTADAVELWLPGKGSGEVEVLTPAEDEWGRWSHPGIPVLVFEGVYVTGWHRASAQGIQPD